MNALETVRKWLEAFPQSGVLSGFQVDYTDKIPGTGGIMPDGLVEVRRSRDIVRGYYHYQPVQFRPVLRFGESS